MNIVFDIDGTLTLVGDRLNDLKNKDWDSFYNRCHEDAPNQSICDIYKQSYIFGNKLILLTGRRESCRQKTLDWLYRHGLAAPELLIMRPDNDWRSDTVVKFEQLEKAGVKAKDVDLVFEDRNSMVKAWRDLGVTVCQVADGDF